MNTDIFLFVITTGRSKGGQTRREQLGKEMSLKGGLSTMDKARGERAEEESIAIDESKYRKSP